MKKLFLFILVFLSANLLIYCGKKESTATDLKDKTEKKKEVYKDTSFSENSSYHIKYEAKGEKNGTIELWIKGKSNKININVDEKEEKSLWDVYYKDEFAYIINVFGKKNNVSKENDNNSGLKNLSDLYPAAKIDLRKEKDKDPGKNLVNLKEKLKDFEKIGTEEILGYKCDIYQTIEGSKISIYKEYFALKIVDKKNETIIATAFESDVNLEDDFFNMKFDCMYVNFNDLNGGNKYLK